MKNNDNRRSFIKKVAIGGIGLTTMPSVMMAEAKQETFDKDTEALQTSQKPDGKSGKRGYNSSYKEEHLRRVAFPIGGLGAGMFCIEGSGAVSHMSIRNRPEIFHEPNMFAAIAVKGEKIVARVLEGPVEEWKMFGQRGTGNGASGANYGLPRFNSAVFSDRFPFATIDLEEKDIPLKTQIIGWSPFIPTDEDNSGLPAGALEYKFTNSSNEAIEAVFSYNSRNFVLQGGQKGAIKKMSNGFILSQEGTADKPHLKTDFAIFTNEPATVDYCWFRGGWFDPLTMVWNTIKEGKVKAQEPDSDAPGASLFVPFKLNAGEQKTIRLMMAWYVPDSDLHIGDVVVDPKKADSAECCITPSAAGLEDRSNYNAPNYKPWYSSKFKSIEEVSDYWKDEYDELQNKSTVFRDAFYSSTLPAEVIEAVAANLTILKSPTVLRQFDGRLWSWEGCGDDGGCCHGSCTHVWNYAQAIPHLFPSLERSLRTTEFCENQNFDGHQQFRANMPISSAKHDFHAAADGQLGGIMKVYREWRISGDAAWLKKMYPMVKTSMDYAITTWDPGNKGIIEEPHHNTYDIEFWGPDGMCTSFYLGALTAFIKMGQFLKKDISKYKALYTAGRKFMETELYNGEYFNQKIQWTGLKAPNPVNEKSFATQYTAEALEILKIEGPKYQYGTGCLSDGILGGWISRMCGLEEPLDIEKTKSHLLSVHKYNLKSDLSDHVNPQRPSYAAGHEGGLLLCSWPKGGMLSLPFVYSNEVWTGIEYQVASHLMLMGQVNEGLDIVKACRDRYDGRVRNPFNEYECGHWYARAMSSYGLIQGLTGVRYDAVDRTLYMDSKVGDFTSFLSTATGFGTVTFKNNKVSLNVAYGNIPIKKAVIAGKETRLS